MPGPLEHTARHRRVEATECQRSGLNVDDPRAAERGLSPTIAVDRSTANHVEGAACQIAERGTVHLVEGAPAEVECPRIVHDASRQKLVGRAAEVEHAAGGHRQGARRERPTRPVHSPGDGGAPV